MSDERLRELYAHALVARRPGERDGCPAPEQLAALARREGSEEARLSTLDHTMTCAECLRELELLRAIEKAGARMAGATPSVPHRMVSWRRAVPLALAASLVIAVGLVVRERDDGAPVIDPSRGAESRLVLRSPSDIELPAGAPLVITWRPQAGATRYVVEVLDENAAVALTETTSDTTVVVRDLGRLAPGRAYRWWVRAFSAAGAQGSSALGRLRVTSQ